MTTKEFYMDEVTYEAMLSMPPKVMLIGNVDTAELGMMSINNKWQALGKKMGFKWDTVRRSPNKSDHYFIAEVTDGPAQDI